MAESSSSSAAAGSSEPNTENLVQDGKTCANCSKKEESPDPEENPTLKPCNMCKSVLYCSRDCKKADTKKHKKVCASLAQEWTKTHEVKMASRAPPKADTHRGGLQKWQFDT